jgi:tetratricopeptide (TPR) repeat protein
MAAASSGNLELVKLLLEKGANPTVKDKDGSTPLMFAARVGNLEIVKLLLARGARLEASDKYGRTALDIASDQKHTEVAQLLSARTAKPAVKRSDSAQRQMLKECLEALQQTPDDQLRRQQIVKLAATLKPPPAIPEEARRYYVKAVAIQKDAKTPEEAALAVSAYQQALLLAPWWADAYYNMSSALRLAGRYGEAISALQWYLASNPKDARAVQDRIYLIEGEQERAAAETSARAQKETEEKAQQQAAQRRRQQEMQKEMGKGQR